MKRICKVIIIITLAVLIVVPPQVTGLIRLSQAAGDSSNPSASKYYESAANLLFWRADLYEKAGLLIPGEPERAIRLFETAREKSSLSPKGQLALGDAYLAIGQMDQAVHEWQELFDKQQEIDDTGARLANFYHAGQDYVKETSLLNLWLEYNPGSPVANERLGLIQASSASPKALPYLKNASAASPQDAVRLENLIQALETDNNEHAYQLTRCGQALAGLEEWNLAEQAFSSAVNANPQYAEAWAWLGLARQHNETPGALQALQTALQLNPQSAAIHAMQGTAWQQTGNFDLARQSFETATKLEPDNPAWWQALGGAYALVDLSKALDAYVRAVNLAPDKAAYWYGLAAFCVEKNAYIEDFGLSAALRAYAIEPLNPLYMYMLGRAQMAAGQTAESEVMFKKALSASPEGSHVHYIHFHLGLLYLQTGREAQSKFEFQQTLEQDPNGPYGAQARKLIERYFP